MHLRLIGTPYHKQYSAHPYSSPGIATKRNNIRALAVPIDLMLKF